MVSQFPLSLAIPCLFLLGATVIMFVYHFLLYIQYREKIILKYCLYLLAISLYLLGDMNSRIAGHTDHITSKLLLTDSLNYIVILFYASFIIEAIPGSREQYKKLYNVWSIASGMTSIYILFCLAAAITGPEKSESLINAMNYFIRAVLVIIGTGACIILFPLMNNKFLNWIKWGAFTYLFFMALVMITMLLIPENKLLGLTPMQFVYLGTFFEIIFFSIAMSYKIKDSFHKITEERNRLSQDLHDDIGASLSSIQIYSSVAEKAMNEDTEKARSILKQINQNAGKVIENMSDIVWAMNRQVNDEKSFSGRIKNYGYELLSQKNIECQYRIDKKAEQALVKPESRKNILLIVKEALNNIAKYSEASNANVYIDTDNNNFLITISDNGKGFVLEEKAKGNGLNNIRQRASALRGTFEINSYPGDGTLMRCSIPLTSISDN